MPFWTRPTSRPSSHRTARTDRKPRLRNGLRPFAKTQSAPPHRRHHMKKRTHIGAHLAATLHVRRSRAALLSTMYGLNRPTSLVSVTSNNSPNLSDAKE